MRSGNENRSGDVVIPDIYTGNDEFPGNTAILALALASPRHSIRSDIVLDAWRKDRNSPLKDVTTSWFTLGS